MAPSVARRLARGTYKRKVPLFPREKENPCWSTWKESILPARLAYQADIFNHLRWPSIQGPDVPIMDASENITSFLELPIRGWLENFQMLKKVLYLHGDELQNSVNLSKRVIDKHLETLWNSCKSHFYLDGNKIEPQSLILFSSYMNCTTQGVDQAKDEFIDLRTKKSTHWNFTKNPWRVWVLLGDTYFYFVKELWKLSLHFQHLSLKIGFSTCYHKKHKNQLAFQQFLCIILSQAIPAFYVLIQGKQKQFLGVCL